MQLENTLLGNGIVLRQLIQKVIRLGMSRRLIDILKRLAADGEPVLDDDFCLAFRKRVAFECIAGVSKPDAIMISQRLKRLFGEWP